MSLKKTDPAIFKLIAAETKRQQEGIELIPSENYVSPAVLTAMGSILTNKYSEGYPRKRYYGGNEVADVVEQLAIDRAKKLFDVPHVNVQPYSGSPANSAVQFGLLEPGDRILGFALKAGGHLTHGHPKVTFSGKYFDSVQYGVSIENGKIDFDEVERLAKKHKPKMIICGVTAYPHILNFKRFGQIADSVGAILMSDIAHLAGLVVAGVHPSPVPYSHVVTTTTHKTLRGPRGAMIMVTRKGLRKDPDMGKKIDKAIFPGLQGGPHDHTTAAIAVALKEASTASFKRYGAQIVKNAKVLAATLVDEGLTLVGGGTENHLMLIDLVPTMGPGGGTFLEYALDQIGITLNKNTIPGDPAPPFYPSGVRLGTPAATSRGMSVREMKQIGMFIALVVHEIEHYRLPKTKEERRVYVKKAKAEIRAMKSLKDIRQDVRSLCKKFPLPY